MSIESDGFQLLPDKRLVEYATLKLRRAVRFEVVMADVFSEENCKEAGKETDVDSDWIKAAGKVRGLLRHSIFNSLVTIKSAGNQGDIEMAEGMIRDLKEYQKGERVSASITPSDEDVKKFHDFRKSLQGLEYEKFMEDAYRGRNR